MSGIIFNDGKILFIDEFLNLKESIEPKETPFGTDFKNKKWEISDDKKYAITFMSHSSEYQVLIKIDMLDGEIGFAAYKGLITTDLEKYDINRTGLNDALKIFNKVIYVILQGSINLNINQIIFNGQDRYLDKTYEKISNNKIFQNKLKEYKFEFIGKDSNDKFIFKKN